MQSTMQQQDPDILSEFHTGRMRFRGCRLWCAEDRVWYWHPRHKERETRLSIARSETPSCKRLFITKDEARELRAIINQWLDDGGGTD